MKSGILASASVAVLLSTMAGTAMAQEAQTAPSENEEAERSLDTVIVTATRREENLIDVPISISAYGQAELSEKGIVGYEGIALETPGVILNKPTANFNNFTARGIATNGYGANLQSTVAIYIDELPISANGNSTILDPNLFDVERVEFLRGPQGTLFGSGSLAGAMRILNRNPDLSKFDYSGLVDFGQTKSDSLRQRYNAMVNLPLVEDKAALRVVGFYRDEEGYVDNIGTGETNSNTLVDYGGRAILLAEPAERLSVRLMANYEKSNPKDSGLINPTLGERTRRSDRPDQFVGELTAYNATVNYEFDWATLTSSSTFSEYDQLFYVDLAGTFAQSIAFALDADAYDDIFVQETRLVSNTDGPLDWAIGGFYYDKTRTVDYNYRSSPQFLAARGITGLPDEYYQRFSAYADSTELAGFGEVTYHFTDQWSATGGLRYGNTEVQAFTSPGGYNSNYLTLALFGLSGPVTITPVPAATGVKAKEKGPSYKASLSYEPNDNLTTYATYATGFRAPVRNARAGAVSTLNPNDLIIPDGASSDDLKSYEVGVKGNWMDGKVTAHLAAYYIDWSNIQVQANRVSDSVQFATNIGKATSKGIEFEVSTQPIEGLYIGFNGALNDAKVDELSPAEAAISGAVEGARLSAPKFQGAIYGRYDFGVTDTVDGFIAANIQHVGSYPGMFPNVPGNPNAVAATYGFTESFENVNMSLGFERGEVIVTGYVENLFDNDSITYVHPEAFLDGRFGTLRPRTIGIRLSYGL